MPLPIDPDMLESSIKPTDDFFSFVNRKWIDQNPIPADESRWGSFNVLNLEVEHQLKTILEGLASQEDVVSGSPEQKVRDFYRTAIDVERRNALGIAPLAPLLAAIDDAADTEGLLRAIGTLHRSGVSVFWQIGVEQDEKQSELVVVHLHQGGLGLPDRDYYLASDERNAKIRLDYAAYMKDLFVIGGFSGSSGPVFDLETRLARASRTQVALRDVERQYNKIDASALRTLAPHVPWDVYFASLKGPHTSPHYIVGQPEFFEEVDTVFDAVPIEVLKLYMHYHVLNVFAPYLSEAIEQRRFDFYARTFRGTAEMKPLWRRALQATDAALDEALGKIYVQRYFSEDAKKKIKDLVENLTKAYEARIRRLDWMGPATKEKAIAKLRKVSRKLGYPDVWKDMASLAIGDDSYVGNAIRAQIFEFDRKMKEVGGSVNRDEWLMPPQMVNAYYMPPMNEIAFPAAILQPPFFDPAADDAVNFGGIGSVIGHELTHGFDDQGSLFDAEGNLNHWWTDEDKKAFDAKAEKLVGQFNLYEAVPGSFINGKLTLGENIADLGGLLIAYDGLKLALAGQPQEKIGGFTPEQRFFMAYAITEREHARHELKQYALQIDPHAPGEFRVNGPMSNMREFYDAFDAKPGDKLWREPGDRVEIW